MRKSYIAQSAFTLNEVSIRPGDILVHDPNNGSKLIVYRNREIVRVTRHSALGMQTMLKNAWVSLHEEQSAPVVPVKPLSKAPSVRTEPPPPCLNTTVGREGGYLVGMPLPEDVGSPPYRLTKAERKALRYQSISHRTPE